MSNRDDIRTSNSTDAKVARELIETLVDGQKGYDKLADAMTGDERPELAARFRTAAVERQQLADELRSLAARYGDVVDSDGSLKATLHRGWMTVNDALTGNDATSVINTAASGEEHAVSVFETALGSDISDEFRAVVQRQLATIRSARTELDELANALV